MERDQLLRLIVQQLHYYDLHTLAEVLAESVQITQNLPASNHLAVLAERGYLLGQGNDASIIGTASFENVTESAVVENVDDIGQDTVAGSCLEVGAFDDSMKITPAQPLNLSTTFITTHKNPVTSACFNIDGRYVACGSDDFSLKVLQVDKMRHTAGNNNQSSEDRPLIRTFYDHSAKVNDVCFHPNTRVLASCSDDMTVKLYDLQRVGVKRGFRFLQDQCIVRSIAFHPCGDYIFAGTSDNLIHMFDLNHMTAFSPTAETNSHTLGINQIRFQQNGKLYVTAGEDGDVKIWDSVSSECIQSISNAHSPIYGGAKSAVISASGKYVLSCGYDGPKVWETSSGKLIKTYRIDDNRQIISNTAAFTWNEDCVVSSDDRSSTVVVWCSRTGSQLERLSGHTSSILNIATSPTRDEIMSCGQDCRARFWSTE